MGGLIDSLPLTAMVIVCFMLFAWAVSLVLRDASVADIFWGPGFVCVAAAAYLASDRPAPRAALALFVTALWGLRLALHIYVRNRGKGEDFRYRTMRRRLGARFWIVSLFTVFLFQGLIMGVMSLPVQIAAAAVQPSGITLQDLAGAAIALAGLAIEAVADWQLFKFKSRKQNRGRPLESGLWRYSQHPNYFGESLVWIGLFVIALQEPGGAISAASPVLILFLLLKVSGIPLLKKEFEARPAYRDYMLRTSVFIPLPPKKRMKS